MSKFSGRRVSVGIGLETVRGTEVAPTYWYPHLDVNIKDTPTALYNESAHGSIIKNNDKTNTLIEGDGTLNGKLYIKGIYYWLSLVFGQLPAASTVVGDTDAHQYDFSLLNSNEHLSATLALKDPNLSLRFPYAMPESFTITWAPDAYPMIEFPIKSKKSTETANTVAYIVDKEFLPKHAALFIADDLAGLDEATALTTIKSFSLTFTKALSPVQTMDSGDTYGDIFNTDFEVTGSIEKLYNDTTYRALDLDDAVKSLRFMLSDSANLAGTTTPTSLGFDISRASFSGYEPSYGLSDISTEKLDFAMLLDTSNFAQSVTAKLINKYTYGA